MGEDAVHRPSAGYEFSQRIFPHRKRLFSKVFSELKTVNTRDSGRDKVHVFHPDTRANLSLPVPRMRTYTLGLRCRLSCFFAWRVILLRLCAAPAAGISPYECASATSPRHLLHPSRSRRRVVPVVIEHL